MEPVRPYTVISTSEITLQNIKQATGIRKTNFRVPVLQTLQE